jgi:hypothetical protein
MFAMWHQLERSGQFLIVMVAERVRVFPSHLTSRPTQLLSVALSPHLPAAQEYAALPVANAGSRLLGGGKLTAANPSWPLATEVLPLHTAPLTTMTR